MMFNLFTKWFDNTNAQNDNSLSFRQMKKKLNGLTPQEEITYIVDDDLYLYNSKIKRFEKLNNTKLSVRQISNISREGDINNQPIMVCYTGNDRHDKVKKYLDYQKECDDKQK